MYYVWVLGRFFYDFLLFIFNKLNLEPLYDYILYTSKYNDDSKFLLRIIYLTKRYFDSDDVMNLKIKKSLPKLFFFKLYFNKKNYENVKLKFLIKQYSYLKFFFKKSGFYNFFKKFDNLSLRLFLSFLVVQSIFFKKYFNLLSHIFFLNKSNLNLVKLNWVWFTFLRNANKFYYVYDFDKFSDWYKINRDPSKFKRTVKMSFWYKRIYKQFKIERFVYFCTIYPKYADNYFFSKFGKRLKELFFTYKEGFLFILRLSNLHSFKFNLANKFKTKEFLNKSPIKFSDSSVNKYISLKSLNNFNFFFLRKNRIFNKSRYSRNRQLYRTGVYWCLWLNIIIVYGLFFLFYRFTFNFGYMWIGVLILMVSMIISKVIKYHFYSLKKILIEFFLLFKWFGLIYFEFLLFFKNFLYKYFYTLNVYNYINSFFSSNFFISFIFFKNNVYSFKLIKYIVNIFKKWDLWIFKFLWQGMREKDTSFLRYKTIIHFFKQLSKIHLMV